jgi:hypothetical protein
MFRRTAAFSTGADAARPPEPREDSDADEITSRPRDPRRSNKAPAQAIVILDEISSRFGWTDAVRQQVQSSGNSSRARHSYNSMNSAAVSSQEKPAAESTASAE